MLTEKKETTTTFTVEGMTCSSCVRHVDEALRGIVGVRDVEVELKEGSVRVCHEPGTLITPMLEALDEAGYTAKVR